MTFVHPATIIIAGGTGSGKSVLTRAIIENNEYTFIDMPCEPKVAWCHGMSQASHSMPMSNARVVYHEGLLDENKVRFSRPDIIVIDDLMTEKSNDSYLHTLFTKISHHLRVTVIYITQNMYAKGQCNMKRNAHYLVMMRNPSDKSQIVTLGRQLYTRKKGLAEHFYEAYDDATRDKFGYLVIDVSPHGDESQKLKTSILPDSRGRLAVVVYQSK